MIGFVVSYVRHAMLPLLTFDLPWVERPVLPMIDTNLSKRDAIPPHFWGLLYDSWKPPAPGEGASIFVTGLESRGPDNQRKRAYMAAMTPDLYDVVYRPKVLEFWDRLFAPQNSGRPLMGLYLDQYMDLFFDLHLGVSGEQVPREAKEFGLAINTVIAYADPRKWVVFKNYLGVRRRRKVVTGWIRDRIADIIEARRPGAKTFVYYWFANGISDADMEAEVLLSFFAMSQWGTALAGVTTRLCGADPVIMDEFSRAMQAGEDVALKRFVMELLRDISPNIGAFSRAKELQPPAVGPSGGYTITPLRDTSYDPKHWVNPDQFYPDRYGTVPASDQIDESTADLAKLRCPFAIRKFPVGDGRPVEMANSAWGTVYGVKEGGPTMAVCDYAGYAPFGFGYRRCPGELLTVAVFADLLRKIWRDGITFHQLGDPARDVPTGAFRTAVDNIGFRR